MKDVSGLDVALADLRRKAAKRRDTAGYGANLILLEQRIARAWRINQSRPVTVFNLVAEGTVVGRVTSGGFGPSVNGPVAMGYVETASSQPGTKINLVVRGQAMPATIVTLPFIPNRFKR